MNWNNMPVLCGILFATLLPSAFGQEAIPAPKPIEPPAPGGRQYQPNEKYTPLQAGQDAYKRAEEQRRWAMDRQLQVQQNIREYNTWRYYNWGMPFSQYGLPYLDTYAPRVGWRVRRNLGRIAPWVAPFPSPLSPDAVYGYQYLPYSKQPIGHEKIYTSPNSYIYKPRYTPPPGKPPATIGTPTQPRAEPAPRAPVRTQPPPASENPLPPPALNPTNPGPGPREF